METNVNEISETKSWLGSSITDICKTQGPWKFSVSPVSPSKYHQVLYQLPVNLIDTPRPHFTTQQNNWDDEHVRMPFSLSNLFPVTENGVEKIKPRWDIIVNALSKPIKSSRELENAIGTYCRSLPKFIALHRFFDEVLDEEETLHFFDCVLPLITKLALALPDLLPGGLSLLKKNHCRSISLSQLQIASLMANAFFCTFPWRKDVAASYPGVNFSRLFSSNSSRRNSVSEKLKCICHYFKRVGRRTPKGVVTFERKFVPRACMPRWDTLDNNLGNTKIHISSSGTIENDGLGMLQVDFANKNVGGGVLSYGCVQEEIRFIICPELIISRLFVERLGDQEAIVTSGIERYSTYSGYGDTFKWTGNVQDDTPYDDYGRRRTTISIIDATNFHKPEDQFYPSAILRELNKAFVGFSTREKVNLAPVATGNWGCGAFHGNANLKSLIQLMACSAANRDLVYFSFGNDDLKEEFYNMHLFLATNRITITQLWRFLCKFGTSQLPQDKLYSFIQQAYFDSKMQPTIKKFFTFKNTKPNESQPSTSKDITVVEVIEKSPVENDVKINIDCEDVIPSSQPEEISFKKFVKTKNRSTSDEIVKKLPKNHNDIFEIIDIIDGNANNAKDRNRVEEQDSFLSEIDKLKTKTKSNNRSPEAIENEMNNGDDETMDVDEIIIDASPTEENSICESKPSKRKITDYFVKSSS